MARGASVARVVATVVACLAAVLVALMVGGVAFGGHAGSAASAPVTDRRPVSPVVDVRGAVVAAVVRAVTVSEEAMVVTADAPVVVTAPDGRTSVSVTRRSATTPSRAELAEHRRKVTADIAVAFAGPAGQQQLKALEMAVDGLDDPTFASLGAGVDAITLDQVRIDGRTATVSGRATSWASMQQRDRRGTHRSHPRNQITLRLTLTRADEAGAQWRVTGYDSSFAPGSEP